MKSKLHNRRILIDICHPAEVHHFKHVYRELKKQGWEILFAAKRKDVSEALLKAYDLPHIMFSESKNGLFKKLLQLPPELWRFAKIVKSFRPAFILSNLSIHSSWISYLFRITHIAFIDTEHRRILDYLTLPFADIKLTPRAYKRCLGANHFRYNGNHEVTYLHPKRFHPDAGIKKMLGLRENEKYVVVRFVGWQAFHDVGLHGLEVAKKLQLVRQLSQSRKVFITSETALPEIFADYVLKTPVERIHDVLAFADAYIGEGGTMASEAACLGTPAIYLNSLRLGYCEEEERYGLLQHFNVLDERAMAAALEATKSVEHKERSVLFWHDQIDVTRFIVHFLNTFPRSLYQIRHEGEKISSRFDGQ